MALVELQFAKQYSINFISTNQTTNSNLILALESSSKGFRKQLFLIFIDYFTKIFRLTAMLESVLQIFILLKCFKSYLIKLSYAFTKFMVKY